MKRASMIVLLSLLLLVSIFFASSSYSSLKTSNALDFLAPFVFMIFILASLSSIGFGAALLVTILLPGKNKKAKRNNYIELP